MTLSPKGDAYAEVNVNARIVRSTLGVGFFAYEGVGHALVAKRPQC